MSSFEQILGSQSTGVGLPLKETDPASWQGKQQRQAGQPVLKFQRQNGPDLLTDPMWGGGNKEQVKTAQSCEFAVGVAQRVKYFSSMHKAIYMYKHVFDC